MNDGLSDLRRREYFFDRIVLECSRAAVTRQAFTVVAMRLTAPHSSDSEKINRAIRALEPVVREFDCLSSLGPHEIGVLAHGVDNDEAPTLCNNLAQIVANAFPGHGGTGREVIAGYAVFPEDSEEAGTLIAMARESVMSNRTRLSAESEVDTGVA